MNFIFYLYFCLFIILDAEKEFMLQEEVIVLLSNTADELNKRMSEHLEKINAQSDYYRTCNN